MRVETSCYHLKKDGRWLGQILITSDGMFSSVTDYGNFSFVWRHFGEDFKEFLLDLHEDYFARKMALGLSYIHQSKKTDKACRVFADIILPELKTVLRKEKEESNLISHTEATGGINEVSIL